MSKAVIIPECAKDIGSMKDEISISPTEKKDGAMGLFSRLLRFDSLKRNSAPESPITAEPPTTYYGVYIPYEIKKGPDEGALHVYKNKAEALELVRRYKIARFKAFNNRQDAVSFALRGAEPVDTHDGNDNSLMGEKPYPFKAPSPQDMVALRKSIEAGLYATVRDRVWDNPRYLVSSGNTPAIMQEGSRYNALHVAAKAMNAELCNLILTTVGNPCFVQTLYGTDADLESCKEFAAILVDRYLNTPDKAMNETPLHFAAKFGAEGAVDVLTSFAQCDRNAVNKFGERPRDIICKRASNSNPETAKRIAAMLEERYYVPVLHAEDGSGAPTIGRPFTPALPPEINQDPLSPRYEIRAFAGPMDADHAETFRRRWKTPPRLERPRPSPAAFRLKEMTKGLETVGRDLAEKLKVGWKEYWPFLDTFTDLRTPEGLALLENYLKTKYDSACSFAYNDSCVQQQPPDELSLSRISLSDTSHHTPSKDPLSPMSELCVALKTCKITDRPPHWRKTDPIRQRLCRQPTAKPILTNGETAPIVNHTVSQLLCIERTCQVFAKRIADALVFSLTAEPEVAGDSLKSEAKHLQHTIFTYMDDERFQKIDFALIHSRLAQLVVFKLKQQTQDLDDINNLVEFLIKLRCPNDDIFSSDDERKPIMYKGTNRVQLTRVIDGHVRCLSSFICEELTETDLMKGPAISETECCDIWNKAAKCRCAWKIESFERNSKKNASFRKNRSILSTSPKGESFIRRLTFDHEIGDGKLQQNETEKPVSPNSPGGDSAALYTIDTAKCQVVEAEISSDESAASCPSESEEAYLTASEHSDAEPDAMPAERMEEASDRAVAEPFIYGYNDSCHSESEEAYLTASEHSSAEPDAMPAERMEEASDRAVAEPFIYGEEPTKMDRLVFDAVSQCEIPQDKFPNVYRWRHTVALYSPTERNSWKPAPSPDDSASHASWSVPANTPRRSPRPRAPPARCSTPKRDPCLDENASRAVPLQVSTWLRVTGPNSPRSASASRSFTQNASFGF